MQTHGEDTQALLGLYAHLSRLYNSSVNAAIAVIFGWLAFIGFSMTMNQQSFSPLKGILISIGLVMFLFGLYFYARIWELGRYLYAMSRDLGLRDYVTNRLPRFSVLSRLNWRPFDQPARWTLGEALGLIFLILSFIIPLLLLYLR